jgi:hypothetical protein
MACSIPFAAANAWLLRRDFGPTLRLRRLFFCPSGVLVGTDDRPIHKMEFPVHFTFLVCFLL